MTLHHILVGFVALAMLASCGQAEPQAPAEAEEDEAADVEIPDIVIPENE